MSHTLKNLVLILISLVLFGAAYMLLVRNSENSDVGGGDMFGAEGDITVRTNQILADTKKIDGYKLDTSIFSDERFNSLKDTHISIPDVYTGRRNPFAPVE